jgi:hypothetical protein
MMQDLKEMTLLCVCMFTSILGIVVEVKQMSTNDRLERKKYMGMCRWGFEIMARMVSRFPNMVNWYIAKNSPKRTGCNLASSEIPRSRNSEICVLFPRPMWLM